VGEKGNLMDYILIGMLPGSSHGEQPNVLLLFGGCRELVFCESHYVIAQKPSG